MKINRKLSELADIRLGYPFRGTVPVIENGEAFVVQTRNVSREGEINTSGLVQTNLENKKTPDYLKSNDILFVAKGAKYFATFVEGLPDNTVCSPHFFIVRIKESETDSVLPAYLWWQLNQTPLQQYFKISAEGTLYSSIRKAVLGNAQILLPSINKQHQIVAMYRTALAERKVLEGLIDNRNQQLEAIAQKELSKNNE